MFDSTPEFCQFSRPVCEAVGLEDRNLIPIAEWQQVKSLMEFFFLVISLYNIELTGFYLTHAISLTKGFVCVQYAFASDYDDGP